MNQLSVFGRIAREVKLFDTKNGDKYGLFSLAVPQANKTTMFLNCSIWGKSAERLSDWCKVGDSVNCLGKLEPNIKEQDKVMFKVTEFMKAYSKKKKEDEPITDQESILRPQKDTEEGMPF